MSATSPSLATRYATARPARATGLWANVQLMWRTQRTRTALAELDPRMLRDIGLTEGQALREAERRPWDLAPRR